MQLTFTEIRKLDPSFIHYAIPGLRSPRTSHTIAVTEDSGVELLAHPRL